MVAREAGTISLWLVYSSNTTVCEALALSEGEINIKTSRSFFAALLLRAPSLHGNTIINSSGGIMLGNMLPIVQAIDKNKLRWFGLVMKTEEESMLRVMMRLKANGKISRGDQD